MVLGHQKQLRERFKRHPDCDMVFRLVPKSGYNQAFGILITWSTISYACLLIEALSLYHKNGDDGSRLATELMPYVISSGMSVIDLFDCLPSSVESLCSLISMFPHDIGIPYIPSLSCKYFLILHILQQTNCVSAA